jgi:acetoin utilization protein AcuB
MTRDVIVVAPAAPLALAWSLMQKHRIRHLLVCERGALLGVVSDRDLFLAGSRSSDGGLAFPEEVVGSIMSMAVVTCAPSASVAEAARMMIDKKIDALPVRSGNRLVGLVTSTDLLALLLESAPHEVLPFEFRVEEVTLAA